MTDHDRPRCRHIKDDGSRCRSRVLAGADGKCLHHSEDPETMAIAQEARERGGRAHRRNMARLKGLGLEELDELETMDDARRWLREITLAVGEGRLTHNQGTSMTRAIQHWMKAHDGHLAETRLAQLEAAVADLTGPGKRAALKVSR